MRKSLCIAALLYAAGAFAAEDVGLVNHLAGDASYVSAGSRARASAYMKVREGDRFTLAPGAQLRLVYFRAGRQESFTGPARFTVGKQASSVQSGAKPEVSALPSAVSQRIARTPELLALAKLGRAGGVAVRGAPKVPTAEQEAQISRARATYEELRRASPADDITPELYLYSVLDEHALYQDMKLVVSEMRRRQPANADVAALAEYVEAKSQGR